ncbi:hypothetical protein SF12_19255, partial [Streptomyces sp. MBRL 601]
MASAVSLASVMRGRVRGVGRPVRRARLRVLGHDLRREFAQAGAGLGWGRDEQISAEGEELADLFQVAAGEGEGDLVRAGGGGGALAGAVDRHAGAEDAPGAFGVAGGEQAVDAEAGRGLPAGGQFGDRFGEGDSGAQAAGCGGGAPVGEAFQGVEAGGAGAVRDQVPAARLGQHPVRVDQLPGRVGLRGAPVADAEPYPAPDVADQGARFEALGAGPEPRPAVGGDHRAQRQQGAAAPAARAATF